MKLFLYNIETDKEIETEEYEIKGNTFFILRKKSIILKLKIGTPTLSANSLGWCIMRSLVFLQ